METCKERLVAILQEKGCHVSTAESCTGGMVAAAIVDVSGASDIFEEGSELTISVTGCAGPGDSADGTKAGTVYIGTCFKGKAKARGFAFGGGRMEVREQSVQEALKFALERIEGGE